MSESEGIPQDAKAVMDILDSMGVNDYEPRVLHQLLNFMYRYTSDVLLDAEAISSRAGGAPGELGAQDVMIAIQNRVEHSFVPPPSLQVLNSLAEACNKRPLPEIKERHGLRIPPLTDCLLNPNYELKPSTKDLPPAAPPGGGAGQANGTPYNVQQSEAALATNIAGAGWQPRPDAPADEWYDQQQDGNADDGFEDI